MNKVSDIGPARAFWRTMRPRQWSKNLVLFAGFIFTLNEKWRPFQPAMWDYLSKAALAFALFCLLSSCIYVINDIKDIDKDRAHPIKRHRPLASGALSPRAPPVSCRKISS